MKTLTSKGVILGHRNLGENDKYIFFYTQELGKLKALAKGSRRINSKFTGHLETLNLANASFYFGPRNTIVTEIVTITPHKKIKESLTKLNQALEVIQLIDKLTMEDEPLEKLFPLIEKTLQTIEKEEKESLTFIAFAYKILDIAGLLPNLKNTDSSLEEKYIKFIEFAKIADYKSILKISLLPEEEKFLMSLINKIIDSQV